MPFLKNLLIKTLRCFSNAYRLPNCRRMGIKLSIIVACLSQIPIAKAETRYVTDRLILNLRSGPTTSHRIIRTLSSGTAVNLVEGTAPENGHVRVTVGANTEGWILEQYLQEKPIARTQLAKFKTQIETLNNQVTELTAQLQGTSKSLDNNAQQQAELRVQLEAKDLELQQIKALSANAIDIDRRNTQLTEANQSLQLELDKLKAENDRLNGSEQRTQWITGAALVLTGILCSWLMTSFSGRRKSNWS